MQQLLNNPWTRPLFKQLINLINELKPLILRQSIQKINNLINLLFIILFRVLKVLVLSICIMGMFLILMFQSFFHNQFIKYFNYSSRLCSFC